MHSQQEGKSRNRLHPEGKGDEKGKSHVSSHPRNNSNDQAYRNRQEHQSQSGPAQRPKQATPYSIPKRHRIPPRVTPLPILILSHIG